MEAWATAVLEWVNCLDILDRNVDSIEELRDGKFFSKLIKILSEKECEDDCEDEELVSRFIQGSYPEFSEANEKRNDKISQETYVASLLLLHASQEPKLHRPMCIKLSNETQLKIKSFLEKVLELGSSITRDDVTDAITDTREQNYVRTPPVTPKMRPLKDFFNSPATTVRKNYSRLMDERTRELRSLKAELETERFEKADLLEDLEIQRQKNASLQIKLQDKIAEMKSIREESARFETPQSSKKKKDLRTPRNRVGTKVQALTEEISQLKSDICNLQEEKESLARKLASAERQCLTFKEKSKLIERNLETLLIQGDIKDREFEELKIHNDQLRSHIQEMRRQTIAEQSFEMEMTALSASTSSLNGSEVLSSAVIDIQLQEAKEESRVFKSQIEELKVQLEAEVGLLESTKKELNEYVETSNKLETEKSYLQRESEKFEKMFLSTEELFKQSEQRNEAFRLDVNELEDKLRRAEGLLSEESNKVRDLEAEVSQKVESLKSEYSRFEALEQEHEELKQEKLNLLAEREDLKNLVASKDDSLTQAQKQRESLELSLRNVENQLEKTQDLFTAECNRIKELESTMNQMKSEHERNMEVQSFKYFRLEEEYVTLDQEKLKLLQEIEDLNLRIAAKEKLLKESFENNEKLALDSQDLHSNLEITEIALAEERNKVANLESAVSQMKMDHKKTVEVQSVKYEALEKRYANLEHEWDILLEDIEDLKRKIASRENSLKEALSKIEKLTTNLRDLNDKLQTAEKDLNNERNKVESLESTIGRMELEHRTLEEKYANLEQERDSLSLKILTSQNLLKESVEKNEILASDLQDISNKLQATVNALDEERNSVKNLESTLAQTKSDKQEFMDSQYSKYQTLEEKYKNLEEDKLDLSQKIEDLNLEVASTKNLLKESVEKSENLTSDLRDLNKKFENAENSLAEERNKVETLESTSSQMKLELENTLDVQISQYKNLEIKYANLEQERDNLSQAIEYRNSEIDKSDNLLKNLNDQLVTAGRALADEQNRVQLLESTVACVNQEKEDALRNQSMSYEALEKEKSNLLTEVDRLTSLISSKEELLAQSQQRIEQFELETSGLKRNIQISQDSLNSEKTRVEDLEFQLNQMTLRHEDSLQKYEDLDKNYADLEQEKVEETRSLNHKLETSQESLTQLRKENESLKSQLEALNDDLKHSLAEGESKIEELESRITQEKREREEILERQSISYQSLEEKRSNLEREKLDILKDSDNLKILLASKEELLQQSQKHSVTLEGDFCAAKDEIKAVRDELKATTRKIEGLESEIAEGKLETLRINQSNEDLRAEINSLKSAKDDLCEVKEKLNKQREELEQEKSRLFREIEEIKTVVLSREDSMKQIQQRNEILDSKVDELDEEVKSAQNLVTEKSTRVKNLEAILEGMEAEKKDSLSMIEKLKLENVEHENLIKSCGSVLTELIQRCSRLTGEDEIGIDDLTILDLSKELKTLINSLEVINSSKNLELKQFQDTVLTLNSTVSKLKGDVMNFEEMKAKDDKVISDCLKEITDFKVIAKEKESLLENMNKLEEQLSVERSKIDSLNEGKAVLSRNLTDVKNSLVILKKEKLILVENVESQNRYLLNKMASISEIIAMMQGQINLDDGVIMQLREEKSCLLSKYEEANKAKTDLASKCATIESDNKSHIKEKKELKEKMNAIRVRNAKLEKNIDELRKEIKKKDNEKTSEEEQSKLDELQNSITKLRNEVQELEAEKIELSKRPTEARLKEIHMEYDQKLEKLKQKMKTAYNEQILKVNKDQERLMQEKLNAQRLKMEDLCRKHAEDITKYKDHVTKLSSDYWDVGEKLLVEKQQKEHLAQQLQEFRRLSQIHERNAPINNSVQSLSSTRNKTSSLDRREFGSSARDESLSASHRMVDTIKEEATSSARRESIQSVHTMQGMGNAFKAEDEEGEVFNTNYLTDMKAGRCSLAPDIDRLSVLQMRNAQCKPHLKSSYPAETQFQPGTFTEEEIKGNELKSPNSRILREKNVERRATATPRRLKDIFGGSSKRQDENVSGTPKGRRLSSIFRKPK